MPAIPSNLRAANQATLLELLLERKAASRAEIAKATGMSQPTAGKIIADLSQAGVVEEINSAVAGPRGVGRPGTQLRLSTSRPRFVVVEFGVEWTRIAALSPSPPDVERWDVQFKTPASEAAWQEKLFQCAERVELKRPWAVLASVPGIVDENAGRILLAPNLHWSEQADLPWILRQMWPAPIGLIQEVRALALGELGTRGDSDDFFMMDIAEGIGGAVMLGRRLYQGALPISGEIGHTPILGNTRQCGCGARGCLETLASERGMIQSLREAKGDGTTFADVVKAAERELPAWLRTTFDAIAMCVAAALNLYGVRRAVLTGRVSELSVAATDYLIGAVQRACMWSRFDAVAVTVAPRRRARGLVLHGLHRFVIPGEWSKKR